MGVPAEERYDKGTKYSPFRILFSRFCVTNFHKNEVYNSTDPCGCLCARIFTTVIWIASTITSDKHMSDNHVCYSNEYYAWTKLQSIEFGTFC